jgi:hypothetical protein
LAYQGADAVLAPHPITIGRATDPPVRRVATLGSGSAFEPPAEAEALLILPRRTISLTPPETPDARPVFTVDTPREMVGGWLQGAVLTRGKGRVALFGATVLFSGQEVADNRAFVRNVMRWLSGRLQP